VHMRITFVTPGRDEYYTTIVGPFLSPDDVRWYCDAIQRQEVVPSFVAATIIPPELAEGEVEIHGATPSTTPIDALLRVVTTWM